MRANDWNPESRTVLYLLTRSADKAMLSPQMPRNWNSLMTLFIWAALFKQ